MKNKIKYVEVRLTKKFKDKIESSLLSKLIKEVEEMKKQEKLVKAVQGWYEWKGGYIECLSDIIKILKNYERKT